MPAVNYLWNPLNDNIVREFDDAGTAIAEYTTESDQFGNVVSQRRSGQDSVYHYDGQGSTLALTDANGIVTDTYAYSAFGEVTASTGTTVNPYRFVGQKEYYYESTNDMCEVRRRSLVIARGRWCSRDVRTNRYGPYLYSNNMPTALFDPSGEVGITLQLSLEPLQRCGDYVVHRNYVLDKEAPDREPLLITKQVYHTKKGKCVSCYNGCNAMPANKCTFQLFEWFNGFHYRDKVEDVDTRESEKRGTKCDDQTWGEVVVELTFRITARHFSIPFPERAREQPVDRLMRLWNATTSSGCGYGISGTKPPYGGLYGPGCGEVPPERADPPEFIELGQVKARYEVTWNCCSDNPAQNTRFSILEPRDSHIVDPTTKRTPPWGSF